MILGVGLFLLPAITNRDSVFCDEVQVLLVSSPLGVEEGSMSHPVGEKGKQLLSVSIPRDLQQVGGAGGRGWWVGQVGQIGERD